MNKEKIAISIIVIIIVAIIYIPILDHIDVIKLGDK